MGRHHSASYTHCVSQPKEMDNDDLRKAMQTKVWKMHCRHNAQNGTDHIPERNCMWDITKKKPVFLFFPLPEKSKRTSLSVVMRNTCQVTNQSSHGELSFHHNPQLRLCWGLCLSTFRVIRRGGTRLKNAAHLTYCHCCELCAIKQKPGVLLEHFQSHIQKL